MLISFQILIVLLTACKAANISVPMKFDFCGATNSCSNDVVSKDCSCSNDCFQFNGCCFDAVNVDTQPDSLYSRQKCLKVANHNSFYMINNCPSDFDDEIIIERCHNSIEKNPLMAMPVTDLKTNITFSNVFCAECNRVSNETYVWNIDLKCLLYDSSFYFDDLQSYVIEKYESESRIWIINATNSANMTYEASCRVYSDIKRTSIYHENRVRKCRAVIDKCAPNYDDERVKKLCKKYLSPVFSLQTYEYYRNAHCAFCNGEEAEDLGCTIVEYGEHFTISFAVLLDMNGGGSVGTFNGDCKQNEIYDPFMKICRQLVCNERQQLIEDRCVQRRQIRDSRSESHLSEFHGDFDSCPKLKLKKGFSFFENGSIYLEKYERVLHPDAFEFENETLYVCFLFFNDEVSLNKFSNEIKLITIIGLEISIDALILHMIVFLSISSAKNLSTLNIASLSMTLASAYTFFMLNQMSSIQNSKRFCRMVAVMIYVFFVASFLWMNVLAYDVWRVIYASRKRLVLSRGRQRTRFFLYFIYVWSVTGLLTLTALYIDSSSVPDMWKPGFGSSGICWFRHRQSLMALFGLPALVIMTLNSAFFVHTWLMIRTRSHLRSTASSQTFKVLLKLFILTGITWVVGFAASLVEFAFLWYLFVILNTLQGLFIFIYFSFIPFIIPYIVKLYQQKKSVKQEPQTSSISVTKIAQIWLSKLHKKCGSFDLPQQDFTIKSAISSRDQMHQNST